MEQFEEYMKEDSFRKDLSSWTGLDRLGKVRTGTQFRSVCYFFRIVGMEVLEPMFAL